jgi:hypothetical protein
MSCRTSRQPLRVTNSRNGQASVPAITGDRAHIGFGDARAPGGRCAGARRGVCRLCAITSASRSDAFHEAERPRSRSECRRCRPLCRCRHSSCMAPTTSNGDTGRRSCRGLCPAIAIQRGPASPACAEHGICRRRVHGLACAEEHLSVLLGQHGFLRSLAAQDPGRTRASGRPVAGHGGTGQRLPPGPSPVGRQCRSCQLCTSRNSRNTDAHACRPGRHGPRRLDRVSGRSRAERSIECGGAGVVFHRTSLEQVKGSGTSRSRVVFRMTPPRGAWCPRLKSTRRRCDQGTR